MPVITIKDARQLRKTFLRGDGPSQHAEMKRVLEKVAKASGQDTVLFDVQADYITKKLRSDPGVLEYRKNEPDETRISLPLSTGLTMSNKMMMVGGSTALVVGMTTNISSLKEAVIELSKGNFTPFSVSTGGLLAFGIYVLYEIVKMLIRAPKASREIYSKFAQNIEANINRELDKRYGKPDADAERGAPMSNFGDGELREALAKTREVDIEHKIRIENSRMCGGEA